MKSYSITVVLLVICDLCFSQQYVVNGVVNDNYNSPVEYFNAVLLNPVDSSLVVGGAFIDGVFTLEYRTKQPLLLKLSGLGYMDLYRLLPVNISNSFDLDTLHLESISLDEINVIAKRPVFIHNGGKLNITVSSTTLEDAGTTIDVLKLSPGLLVDNNNNVSVFGKGAPLVFIDGREVQSLQELETLQSNQIEHITIDRNPSAKYNSAAKAIVLIETIKKKSDQLSLQLSQNITLARKISSKTGFVIKAKRNKFSGHVNYFFGNNNHRNFSQVYERNFLDGYSIYNLSNTESDSNSDNHNLLLGAEYNVNTNSSFSFLYNLLYENDLVYKDAEQVITRSGDESMSRNIFQDGNEKSCLHNISLGYRLSSDSTRRFLIQTDYAKKSNNGTTLISENDLSSQMDSRSSVDNINSFDVMTIKSEYSHHIVKGVSLLYGARMAHISNDGRAQLFETSTKKISYNDKQSITDNIMAGYLLAERKSDKTSLEVGMRTEFTHTKVGANSLDILDSSYVHLFPSICFNITLTDEAAITLNYNKKISRPDFDELNPSVVYYDSLSYGKGNPSVKPSIIHSVGCEIELPFSLFFSAEYNYERNARIVTAVNDKNNPHVIKYTPINIDNSRFIDLGLSYNFSGKRFTTNASCYVEFPYVVIPFMNQELKQRTTGWFLSSSNDYSFSKAFSLYCNLSYQSKTVELMTEYKPCLNLKAGLRGKFFNKRLLVSIDANNILDSYKSDWSDRYGNISSRQITNYDNRYLRFSLRYSFNDLTPSKLRQIGNDDELNRL